MTLKVRSVLAAVCAATAMSCGKDAQTPVSPSQASPQTTLAAGAAADGSTLKVTAPVPQSPVNNARPADSDSIVLVATNSAAKFASNVAAFYHFQVYDANGANVVDAANVSAGVGSTSYKVTTPLNGDATYSWRVRVEAGGGVGPWSTTNTFIAPVNDGFNRPGQLYDPLIDGKTVGGITGPVQFIPGVGLKFNSQLSSVRYQLQSTITEGEFSMLVTGLETNTEGDKTKMFSMAQGDGDVVTNDRRMTVEKRGDPAGEVAWRFITHDDQIDTVGPERLTVNFDPSHTYFWQATWRANRFRLLIQDGGAGGRTIYDISKGFAGRAYDPTPHIAYLGMPPGRSGESGASVDNVVYRQVWLSSSARPAYANK